MADAFAKEIDWSKPLEKPIEYGTVDSNTSKTIDWTQPSQTIPSVNNVDTGYKNIDWSKPTDTKDTYYGTVEKEDIDTNTLLRYGWALETNLIGDAWRLGKAALDPTKTITDVERERIAKIKTRPEFAKLKGGAYDNDAAVWAGRIAVMASDPVYMLMPWAQAARAGKIIGKGGAALASLGGTVGAGDAAIRSYARTGELDTQTILFGAGAGAVGTVAFGAIGKVGMAGVNKAFPNLFSNKKIAEAAAKKVKEGNIGLANLTPEQALKFEEVTKLPNVNKALNNIDKVDNVYESFLKQRVTLSEQYKKLLDQKKQLTGTKKISIPGALDSVVNAQNKAALETIDGSIKAVRIAKNKFKKNFDNKVQKKLDNITKAHGDYYVTVLAALESKQLLTTKVARAFATNAVRPVVGAASGYSIATIFGADDAGARKAAYIGAGLGYATRLMKAGAIPGMSINAQKMAGNEIGTAWLSNVVRGTNIFFSTTTATKLGSHGKVLDQISALMFARFNKTPLRDLSGKLLPASRQPSLGIADNVEELAMSQKTFWQTQIGKDVVQGQSLDIQRDALRIVRGDKISTYGDEAVQLSKRIKGFIKNFRKYYTDVGIKEKEIFENFFFRKYNYQKINQTDASKQEFVDTVAQIFVNLNKSTGGKVYMGLTNSGKPIYKKIKNFKEAQTQAIQFIESINGNRINKIINPENIGSGGKVTNLTLPLSEHIKFERILKGSYKDVEKVLMDKGYIIDDVSEVLNDVINRSVMSVEFARKFGPNGEILRPLLRSLEQQYKDGGFKKTGNFYGEKHEREIKYLTEAVNGLFGRFGTPVRPEYAAGASVLASLSNFAMMDKVAIANLGDIVQPFANSRYVLSALQTAPIIGRLFKGNPVSLSAKKESGVASLLEQRLTQLNDEALRKGYLGQGADDLAFNFKDVLNVGKVSQWTNKQFFKLVGLNYITDVSRRFAFTAGAVDAHKSARSIIQTLAKGKFTSIDDIVSKNPKAVKHLIDSGVIRVKNGKVINTQEVLRFGSVKNVDDLLGDKLGENLLMRAGQYAMNRDAIIPQVGNRLLYTQSRNPYVRLLGQFSSWAQAKSSQTDALVSRIEDGNVKQAVMLAGSLAIYGGIKDLRDMITYGDTRNNSPFLGDPDVNVASWLSEANHMSGMMGWLPTTLANQFVGYNAKRPTDFFPAAQTVGNIATAGSGAITGSLGTTGWKQFFRSFYGLMPFPTLRKVLKRYNVIDLTYEREPLNIERDLNKGLE